ncbi:MAG: Stk1 family PASTA domain-containing Ser/Thr kinase [Oscillospiraceae bacterium]|nr:Stk1 family PASTA domain-containing Ser/Thr kinase [Oscillospiraceae bacterium]
MDKNIGVMLDGRYEIKKRIGVGGMADVYRAYDRSEGRDVAVKILKNEYTKNDEFLQRFKNESKAVSMLSHPNIVKVLDVGYNEEMRFIVMEYIDGITLKDYIEMKGRLDWNETSHLVIQILRALGHAHDRGIIHRDVKPQNIMMFEDGTIKVMDFGIAKFTYELGITATAQTIGSVHYISPEQASGKMTDGTSDIYSVGIVLYELLTGRKPFDTENPLTVALMQMNDIPVRPRSINPDISVGVEEIILKAIEKNPSDRYHTARDMINDIEMMKNNPDHVFGYKFSSFPEETDNNETEDIKIHPEPDSDAVQKDEEEVDYLDYDPDEATPNYFIDSRRRERDKNLSVPDNPEIETVSGNKLLTRLATIGTVIAMITIVAVISGFVSKIIHKNDPSTFPMPSLIQYNYDDMVKKYSGKLIITVEGEPVYSEYVADTIVYQSIDAGTEIEKGTEVFVNISNGKNTSIVPEVDGLSSAQAVELINAAGFDVVQNHIFNDIVEYDKVIRVSPVAGTEMEITGKVTIYISKGKQTDAKILPNVVGKSKDEALRILKEAGYTAEVEEKDDKAPEGQVFSQNFPGDTLVNPSEKIIIYVSTGKLPTADVPFTLTFPERAYGVVTFKVYIDEKLVQMVEDINIEGFTEYSFDITGSEKQNVKVEVMSIVTGDAAVIGHYKFDFEEKKYEVINENMKGALEAIKAIKPEETTQAATQAPPPPPVTQAPPVVTQAPPVHTAAPPVETEAPPVETEPEPPAATEAESEADPVTE